MALPKFDNDLTDYRLVIERLTVMFPMKARASYLEI